MALKAVIFNVGEKKKPIQGRAIFLHECSNVVSRLGVIWQGFICVSANHDFMIYVKGNMIKPFKQDKTSTTIMHSYSQSLVCTTHKKHY